MYSSSSSCHHKSTPPPQQPPPPDANDDPFNDQLDSLLTSIDIDEFAPPPEKRARQETNAAPPPLATENDDPFGNDDDDELYEIAEALEVSEQLFAGCDDDDEDSNGIPAVGNDGVPPENRFLTKLGRPHPMLIPQVYETVISFLNDPSSLLTARSVCTAWKDTAQNKTFKLATLRNARHVVERYPYGLAYGERDPLFKPPFPRPHLTRMHIADPCIAFAQDKVEYYLIKEGAKLKYFALDANLFCSYHWRFVRNVLTNWCPNLVELQLVGVSCVESLISYSEVYSVKRLKIRKLVVVCNSVEERNHHHTSTVSTTPFDAFDYTANRLVCRRDGGLLTRIFKMSAYLTALTFHFNFMSASGYLAHMRMFRADFDNLSVLELVAVGDNWIRTQDIRMLMICSFPLTTLKLGPLWAGEMSGVLFERFLTSMAGTLVHLELAGVKQRPNYPTLGVVRFSFPELPLLRTLKITNMSRVRVGNLNFLYRMPGLDELDLGLEPVPQRFKTNVFRSLTNMFIGQFHREHVSLRRFALGGCYAHVINHSDAARQFMHQLCPQVQSLRVACRAGNLKSLIDSYSSFPKLEELSIDVNHEVLVGFTPFAGIFSTGYDSLRVLSISVLGNVPLRLQQTLQFGTLYQLTLDGVMLHDDESSEVAKALAGKVNYTNFKKCRIVTATRQGRFAGGKSKTVHNVTLTLVNLHVLIHDYFHVL